MNEMPQCPVPEQCVVACTPDFCTGLLIGLQKLQNTQSLTDYTVKVNDKVIPCHKIILAAACPYFAALFNSGMKEVQENEACLDHLDKQVVERLVLYFYSGKIAIDWNKIQEAIDACEFLQLPELKLAFSKYIVEWISSDNCLELYKFADKYNLYQIQMRCKKIMWDQFPEVSKGSEFKSLSLSKLLEFIQDEDMVLPRSDAILDACMGWVNNDRDTRVEALVTAPE